jgi:predicted DNA-binding protein with PD1-like motif
MFYKKFGSNYVIRLVRGEEILSQLISLCEKEKIGAGFFNGLGAADNVELAHYSMLTKAYTPLRLAGQYEITSLHGNISSMDDKVYVHSHITVADDKFRAVSGHLKSAAVSATCEIFLVAFHGELLRARDKETGINLLDL